MSRRHFSKRAGAGWVIGTYLGSRRFLNRLLNGIRAVHQGLWLGAMSADTLQRLTNRHYESTQGGLSDDVDYFDPDYNLSGLRYWEVDALDRFFDNSFPVLIGAAGGGREVYAVSERFARVDAFECNPRLAASCRAFLASRGLEVSVADSDPDSVPPDLPVYGGAILGWGAYLHIRNRERRIGLLRQFHRHLRPGAPFLFSFLVRGNSISGRLTYYVANFVRTLKGAARVEMGDRISSTFDHYLSEAEVRDELSKAGFDLVLFSRRLTQGHAVAIALPANTPDEDAALEA